MNRTLIVASVCFVLGAFVGFAVHRSVGPTDDPNSVEVLVAARNLQPDDRLQEGDVRVTKFPRSLVPNGALTQTNFPLDVRLSVVGQFPVYPIAEGEIMLVGKLCKH